MLKRLSIENFKSFRGRTDIDLAAINVFAGANSSGKSTIIQSILLLKQTLQYAPPNRAIALNGPLLKLGTFDDIKNARSKSDYIGVSWVLDVEEPKPPSEQLRLRSEALQYPFYFYGRSPLSSAECEVHFDVGSSQQLDLRKSRGISAGDEMLQLQPSLAYSCIQALTERDPKTAQRLKIALSRSTEPLDVRKQQLGDATISPATESLLRYDVSEIDSITKEQLLESKPDGRIVGGLLRHFFPYQIGILYDEAKERARRIAEAICTESFPQYRLHELVDLPMPPALLEFLEEHVPDLTGASQRALFSGDSSSTTSLAHIVQRLRQLRVRYNYPDVRQRALGLVEFQPQIENILRNHLNSRMDVDFAWHRVLPAVQYSSTYFVSAVRYLGPLRDEPKPIYPLEALANPTEVGYKGEHTAAVLDLHRDLPIEYIPSSFVAALEPSLKPQICKLHDAVVDWLSYVGIAEEVKTGDRGKIGHQLQVQTSGLPRFHDLTNVGVGVSQVLPIIVMALLAEPPCLLIFEQPELHLHPKVQARLADFFLSVAIMGKQCLLETHSEYLVERFRRRIAEAQGDDLTKILKIYFTERLEGRTVCRPVDVSRYGAIADYPKEFFDQSHHETERILQAARAKRAGERKEREGR